MDLKTNDLILLTGAGFSKNFGGFLGEEMWAKIFNSPFDKSISEREGQQLKEFLLRKYDFEKVYSSVLEGSEGKKFTRAQKLILSKSIKNAYDLLDDNLRSFTSPLIHQFEGGLLSWFFEKKTNNPLWFTINQDILIERRLKYPTPGMKAFGKFQNQKLAPSYYQTLPSKTTFQDVVKEINANKDVSYIKLHGSYGWLFNNYKEAMVIGVNKKQIIDKEPLLKAYFQVFKHSIKEMNKKILIIGYSFRDKEINKILIDGVEKRNLKLYIVNPKNIGTFRNNLLHGNTASIDFHKKCWNKICGYFPYKMQDFFPSRHSEESAALKEIRRKLTF